MNSNRPGSYVSELSGLTCKTSGFFPHPTNSTKFYRCVALHLNSTFMIYLFSCEVGLLYEPTVAACVKSLGEEQMESSTPTNSKTIFDSPTSSTNISDYVRNWETERCRNDTQAGLFRSPVNCRRFFRCSRTQTSVKVERFSCPTGLFFDEATHACTWASETSSCNVLDTSEDLQITIDSPASAAPPLPTRPSSPSLKVMPTLATIWLTSPTTKSNQPRKTTILDSALTVYPTTTANPATTSMTQDTVTGTSESSGNLKQFLRPPPYLTATGVLVVDGSEFKCETVGSFPSSSPCVFYKCEKYVWLPSFLLFRFQCPPHTVFDNGTCQYNPTADCVASEPPSVQTDRISASLGSSASGGNGGFPVANTSSNTSMVGRPISNEIAGTSNISQLSEGKTDLCLKEGIFPLPFATSCSTRFMICRYLSGPLHFFVSVHECPPSLVFSPIKKQCIDPSTSNLNCLTAASSEPSLYVASNPGSATSFVVQDLPNFLTVTSQESTGTAGEPSQPCQEAGFTQISCHRFRRCQWLLRPEPQSGVWVSYEFECGKGMVFDVTVTACVRPLDSSPCPDEPSASQLSDVSLASLIPSSTATAINLAGVSETLTMSPTTPITISTTTSVTEEQPSSTATVATWTLPSTDTDAPGVPTTSERPVLTSATQVEVVGNRFNGGPGSVQFSSSSVAPPFSSTVASFATAIWGGPFKMKARTPVCFRSGYFLYPSDQNCQRFYRCLQLTPEPNSFVMLHYRCDDGFVFDGKYSACTAAISSPTCTSLQQMAGLDFGAGVPAPTVANVSSGSSGSFQNGMSGSSDEQWPTTTTAKVVINRLPIKILPQVWQMAGQDADSSGSAALVCTTQRIYRLQTCGYYYSCIEKEKGKFHLQEIYCETLYLDVNSGQCVEPPVKDPCSRSTASKVRGNIKSNTTPNSWFSTSDSSSSDPTSPVTETTTTPATTTPSTTLPPSPTTPSTTPLTTLPPSPTTLSTLPTAVRTTPELTTSTARTMSTVGSLLVFTHRPSRPYRVRRPVTTTTANALTVSIANYQPPPPTTDALPLPSSDALAGSFTTPMTLSAYRETFNKLYAQLVNGGLGTPTTTRGFPDDSEEQIVATTAAPALILNFNTVSGQLTNLTTGVTFQCRAEGYFRNSRDAQCSKFYLCVRVGPRQYNLFEFMCLPHNGIQWRYNQNRNACVDPQDVLQC
ncbi:hypothetical protein BV898_01338 [Hypsibius exemplaris]|uniref:Chitin-binding type-2 domain-containing protein n=1 Tax=Hypsibius exemplaris TaxID=2072580 RepID=A0A1W0XB65_HYPEX|nr:hypothetical protein BV898_01338 [Hypsibius exemplaris]